MFPHEHILLLHWKTTAHCTSVVCVSCITLSKGSVGLIFRGSSSTSAEMLTRLSWKEAKTVFYNCTQQRSGWSVLPSWRSMSLTTVRCPTVPLSNGLHIPILGLGTSHRGGYCHDAVVYALTHCGVRHIDTAKYYGCEEKLGKAIKESGLPRSDLWITNKLWTEDYGYKAARKTCLDSCSEMGLEYLDLYLMHWPDAQKPGFSNREVRAETWRALEELYKEGVCRAIGVSNFVIRHLEQLKEDCSMVPHVNQVEYHPFQQNKQLIDYCRQEEIVFEGFSPLAKGQVINNPIVCQIAEKHQRTPAQISIRWSIQTGVVTIPKSIKKNRVQENCDVFGFQLEDDDMAALATLHDGRRVSWDPTNVE